MGMEIPSAEEQSETDASVLTSRPSILLVGPRNVGKRSILNSNARLLNLLAVLYYSEWKIQEFCRWMRSGC